MIQALPPAEIRFILKPEWRPWENPKEPVFNELIIPEPRRFRAAHLELPQRDPRAWIHPVADFLLWVGLNIAAKPVSPRGSTWNTPQENPQYWYKSPYTEWKGSLIFRQ